MAKKKESNLLMWVLGLAAVLLVAVLVMSQQSSSLKTSVTGAVSTQQCQGGCTTSCLDGPGSPGITPFGSPPPPKRITVSLCKEKLTNGNCLDDLYEFPTKTKPSQCEALEGKTCSGYLVSAGCWQNGKERPKGARTRGKLVDMELVYK